MDDGLLQTGTILISNNHGVDVMKMAISGWWISFKRGEVRSMKSWQHKSLVKLHRLRYNCMVIKLTHNW